MDETYIKVKGKWVYLYRAVDSHGDTLDFIRGVPTFAKAHFGHPSGVKRFKSHHWFSYFFDKSMVLFDR
jgi:hypothetical protein